MRRHDWRVRIFILLCLAGLCSCSRPEAATSGREEAAPTVKEEKEEADNAATPEVTTEAEKTADESTKTEEYDGTDPYQGSITNTDDMEEAKSLSDTISKEEAIEDLTYFYDRLKERHPAWVDGSVDKTNAIDAVYQESVKGFSDEVSVLEVYQCSSRIASILRDGHTRIFLNQEPQYLNVYKQISENGNPTKVDDLEVSELDQRSKDLMSYELEPYREDRFKKNWLFSKDKLALLGIDTTKAITYTFENGKTCECSFDAGDETEKQTESQPEEKYEWVSYEIDEKHNLGIFTLKECINDLMYTRNLNDFFEQVSEKGITNIAVDLRGNGGGNSEVADNFITHLNHKSYKALKGAMRLGDHLEYYKDRTLPVNVRKDAYEGKVYVLTDVNSFSAAMDFGMLIQDNGFGEIVGEASGNQPHCYIDVLYFQMPNSKLGFSMSYKISFRIDETKAEEPLTPDYEVDPDKALEKVYELIQ